MFSQFDYRRSTGSFDIAGSVRTNATGASVAEIMKEVKAMREHALPAEELENARNAQVLSLPGHFDTNEGVSSSLAGLFVYDMGLDYYSTLAGEFATVTAAQVQAVARKYLAPESLVVVAVGDRKKIEPQLKKLKLGTIEVRREDGQAQ